MACGAFAHPEMFWPGVSRRLADLIEATFPEKIQLRRYNRLPLSSLLGLGLGLGLGTWSNACCLDQFFTICLLHRQTREREAATRATPALLQGKLSSLFAVPPMLMWLGHQLQQLLILSIAQHQQACDVTCGSNRPGQTTQC